MGLGFGPEHQSREKNRRAHRDLLETFLCIVHGEAIQRQCCNAEISIVVVVHVANGCVAQKNHPSILVWCNVPTFKVVSDMFQMSSLVFRSKCFIYRICTSSQSV